MRKKLFAIIAGAALSASVLVVTANPVSAGEGPGFITVDITKEVLKAPEQETSFGITLTCTDEDDHSASADKIVEWEKVGKSWELSPETFSLTVFPDYEEWESSWVGDVTCTVTEPVSGGATSTTITCEANEELEYVESDGASLIINVPDLTATQVGWTYGECTVVNEFTPAVVTTTTTAAAAVVVQPKFTG